MRQDRCLLLGQDRCLLLQEQTSVLSQLTVLKSQKSQLWQCHNVQVSEVSTVQVADRRSGPKSTKTPKWVQNGRQVLRIDPRACHGHFLASGTGPAAQNPPKWSKNRLFGVSRWGHSRFNVPTHLVLIPRTNLGARTPEPVQPKPRTVAQPGLTQRDARSPPWPSPAKAQPSLQPSPMYALAISCDPGFGRLIG